MYDHHASPIALQEASLKRKTRNLDALPMKYSAMESRSQMATLRSKRCQTAMSVNTTMDESVHQRNLSKRLFEDAVDRATSAGSVEPSLSADSMRSFPSLGSGSVRTTLSYTFGHKRQKHNGFTLTGSPLYNKQDTELYIVRSESSLSKNSISQVQAPELQRQIERITSEFRVVPSNAPSTLNGDTSLFTCRSRDYLLIPLDGAKTHDRENSPIMSRSMLEGFRYKTNSNLYGHTNGKPNAKKYVCDLLSTASGMVLSEESENPVTVPEVTVQNTRNETRKPSLDKNSSKKSNAHEEQSRQLKPFNQTQNGLLAVQTSRSRPSSACSSR